MSSITSSEFVIRVSFSETWEVMVPLYTILQVFEFQRLETDGCHEGTLALCHSNSINSSGDKPPFGGLLFPGPVLVFPGLKELKSYMEEPGLNTGPVISGDVQ